MKILLRKFQSTISSFLREHKEQLLSIFTQVAAGLITAWIIGVLPPQNCFVERSESVHKEFLPGPIAPML